MRRVDRTSTLLLAGLFMAACQDLPTTLPSTAPPLELGPSPALNPWGRDRNALECYVSRRVQGRAYPYEYGTIRPHFPSSTMAADGSTRLFRFRIEAAGEEPLAVGSCRIPNTPEAVEFIVKRLHLDRPRTGADDQEGEVHLQGCVTDGECELEGLVVVAPGPGQWDFGEGGGAGGYDSSYGDDYDSYGGGYGSDPGPDGTYRDPCQRDANGDCIVRSTNADEWSMIGRIIDRMRANNAACAGAKAALKAMYDRGQWMDRFRVWDGYDIDGNSQRYGENRYDADGVYIEVDSYWLIGDWSVLVHEGMHTYYNSLPPDNVGRIEYTAESFAAHYEDTCW